MAASAEDQIDAALNTWRQGDFTMAPGLEFLHLADLTAPLSPASRQAAVEIGQQVPIEPQPILDDQVPGMVMVSQTCDVVRSCRNRPFVEVAPLISVSPTVLEEARRLKRPALAYIPGAAASGMVADLDRVMTVEKGIAARWPRTAGYTTDEERRKIANAFARKRSRFAFPTDFVGAVTAFSQRLIDKYQKQTEEGAHIRALTEIRVMASPSWDDPNVSLTFWFIKESEPSGCNPDWAKMLDDWVALIDQSGRFQVDAALVVRLQDITAQDYVDSDPLDYERLSSG